jgi:putative ABC transport system permease protein
MLRPTTVVAVACIVVLLATCLSVANLLIARLIGRQHEWTVRRALGAGPMQLAKAMLVDSLVLLVLGAGLAALVARLAVPVALWLFLPAVDPDSVRLSVRYLGWGTGLTLFVALLAVVAPAVAMIRRIGNTGLAVGARPVEEVRPRVRAGLVAAQLAIAVTLFGTAVLVVRSLVAVKHVDPGFDVSHVLFVRADLRHSGFSPTVSERALETVRDRVSRLPGVRAVSLFRGGTFTVFNPLIARVPPAPFPRGIGAEGPFVNEVDSAFFAASGLRLLRGRVFRSNEHFVDRVAIANEALIKTFWPRGLPATPRLEMLGEPPSVEIVGVVANSPAFRVAERPVPMLYLPLHPGPGSLESLLLVRAAGPARDAVASIRSAAVSAAPDLAGVDIQPMADIMAPEFRTWQTASLVTTGFAAIALGLSVVAIFGLLTYLIRARTFEFGVRITLGADAKDIALLVGRGVAGMALLGVASGGVGAWILGRLGQALLFGVSPADPVSLVAAAGCGMLAAVGASLVPVWHAIRISPIGALRSE